MWERALPRPWAPELSRGYKIQMLSPPLRELPGAALGQAEAGRVAFELCMPAMPAQTLCRRPARRFEVNRCVKRESYQKCLHPNRAQISRDIHSQPQGDSKYSLSSCFYMWNTCWIRVPQHLHPQACEKIVFNMFWISFEATSLVFRICAWIRA